MPPPQSAVASPSASHAIPRPTRVPIGRTAHLSKPELSIICAAQWTQKPRRCCSTRCRCSFVAALYLAVGVARRPGTVARAWQAREIGVRDGAGLPGRGSPQRIAGVAILFTQEPLAGNRWSRSSASCSRRSRSSLARTWRDPALLVTGGDRAARRRSVVARDRELAVVGRSRTGCSTRERPKGSRACSSTSSPASSSSTSPTSRWSRTAAGERAIVARAEGGATASAWSGRSLDLEHEPSGISTACAKARRSRSSTQRARRSSASG